MSVLLLVLPMDGDMELFFRSVLLVVFDHGWRRGGLLLDGGFALRGRDGLPLEVSLASGPDHGWRGGILLWVCLYSRGGLLLDVGVAQGGRDGVLLDDWLAQRRIGGVLLEVCLANG